MINDGESVIDIGANIGAMTYYFSKKLSNSAVHSFEPVLENLEVLKRVKNKFNLINVKIYPFALGNKNGHVNMIMPESNKVYFHGLSHVKQGYSSEDGRSYNVEIKKLDDLEDFAKIKISAIKIDVEEYEFNVLKGAEKLISKNRPMIYCELWEGENRTNNIGFISNLNYRIFVNQNNNLTEYKDQNCCHNFFFIPAEHCENLKLSL
ncbi:FkbM family methyltransferase [Bacteroidota bacterium]